MAPDATYELADPEAQALDAFTLKWSTGVIYMFPPIHKSMYNRIISRVIADQAEVVLVMPLWRSEALATAMKMLQDTPLVLPLAPQLLWWPQAYVRNQEAAEQARQFRWWTRVPWKALIAMRISGKDNSRMAYLRRLRTIVGRSTSAEQTARRVATICYRNGRSSYDGCEIQARGRLIPSYV